MILKVDKLCKKIGKKTILKDVSFEINEGDILAFIGSSKNNEWYYHHQWL